MNKLAQTYLVVGLGKTGLSCVKYLVKQNINIIVVDSRENPPELSEFQKQFPQISVHLGEFDPALFLKVNAVVLSPGLSPENAAIIAAKQAGIPILGDIELFAGAVKAPIIGITGTNAKGTVTTLVGEMLQAAGLQVLVGGNIGTPALDLLNEPIPDYYVLELSSFQLELTHSLSLKVAVILNISEDHLDRHHTLANYIAAKQRIYQHCENIVYNRDDAATAPINAKAKSTISFGLSSPPSNVLGLTKIQDQYWLSYGEQLLLNTQELSIKGTHNWANALAMLAIGFALRIPVESMLQTLRAFKGLPHRCEWILEHDQINWYDDSKGTNVGSTVAAITGLGNTLSGKIILIAGGLGKDADFSPLQMPVKQFVREVILLGRDAPKIAAVLQNIVAITHVKNLVEAVSHAKQIAKPGDVVLLSPACASMDMFRDYAERGDIFKAAVHDLYFPPLKKRD